MSKLRLMIEKGMSMTENEIILEKQIADDLSAVLKEAKEMGCKEVAYFRHIPLRNVETVIKALEEIQQYRAIGTIEEFKALKEKETEILLKDGQLLYQQGVVDGYAKGIDVYVEKLKYNFGNDEELDSWATYDEIAEQLKAGGIIG